tara:strand:- start:764 stop:1270 length:507 start_codon:yes stop_codon:yes gene_type:complete
MKKDTSKLFMIGIFGVIVLLYLNELSQNQKVTIQIISESEDEDDEYEEPGRYYDSRYITRKQMSINVPTRGEPPDYQQIGIITGEGDENIKPLYGRQTYRGSNQWNYFTSLDSHLSTKIPVFFEGDDCTEERGCKEIRKNDTLNMSETGNQYSASIYNTISPRYIPYV